MAEKRADSGRETLPRAAALGAVLLCVLLSLTPSFREWEGYTEDLRFALRGPRPSAAKVVVIALDDDTIENWSYNPQIAWGGYYARLIGRAREYGAVAVGIDAISAFPTDEYLDAIQSPESVERPDSKLADALSDAGGTVVLAKGIRPGGGLENPILAETSLTFSASSVGAINLPSARSGAYRDAFLYLYDAKGEVLHPGFAPCLAARASGDPSATAAPLSENVLRKLAANREMIRPADTDQAVFGVNFLLEEIPTISARSLADGTATAGKRALLKNAVAIIGFTDTVSPDRHPAPLWGKPRPGVYLHAEAVATLVDGRSLRHLPWWLSALVTLTVGVIAAVSAEYTRHIHYLLRGIAAFALLLLWGGVAQLTFTRADTVLPLLAPALTILAVLTARSAERVARIYLDERDLRSVFSRYLSPAVSDYLMANAENRQPGGKSGTATCLFLDVRDFTRFSSERDPQEVITELNRLFETVIPILVGNGANMVKYLGDGLLAVFNVPLASPDGDGGAQQATDAALAVLAAVERLHTERVTVNPSAFPLRIGIGLHTGPVVYGNLGAAERPEFTVIGATVNIAARLEAMTKPDALNAPIVTSAATYQALTRRPPAEGPILRELRGQGVLPLYAITPMKKDTDMRSTFEKQDII